MSQKCATPYCRKQASKPHLVCHSCRAESWKRSKPFSYHYNAFRNNARRRGKDFAITLEQYTEFAIQHGLIDSSGNKRSNLSIDRVDPTRGYHLDNIQVLTISENTRKRFVDYYASQAHEMCDEERAYHERQRQQLQADIAARQQQDQFNHLPF